MAPTALAIPSDGGPLEPGPGKVEAPGGDHGGIYAEWEYPDFAWTDAGADALAEWLPTPLAVNEPVASIDWSVASEIISDRTATTATYILSDTDWAVTRAWPAPVHYRGPDGSWLPIETTLQATERGAHSWEVGAHQTPMHFPTILGEAPIEVAFLGFSEPLRLGLSPRLTHGDDAGPLDGGAIDVDGARAAWDTPNGWRHATEVTGFGLVQVVQRLDGERLDVARFEQLITLPSGLEIEAKGQRVRLVDDTGVEQARLTGVAHGGVALGGVPLIWSAATTGRQVRLSARVPAGAVRGDLRHFSLQWRLGPDAVRERMGGLQSTGDADLQASCLGCASADDQAGLWAELDWSAGSPGDGALRAWLSTPALLELAELSISFAWQRPTEWTTKAQGDEASPYGPAIPWSLPADWATMPPSHAPASRVGSGAQLDM
ncbi:MAG: hypothetical protein QF464_13750, partial [Myxococcota bacterium]|nr:hypothetical protein [Myxococcota bacterium]